MEKRQSVKMKQKCSSLAWAWRGWAGVVQKCRSWIQAEMKSDKYVQFGVTFVWPSSICLNNWDLAAIKIYIWWLRFLKRRIYGSRGINQHMCYWGPSVFQWNDRWAVSQRETTSIMKCFVWWNTLSRDQNARLKKVLQRKQITALFT